MTSWYETVPSGIPVMHSAADVPSRLPPLLLIHENRGLSPYMIEVIGDLVAAGFDAHAPDLLHRLGGSAAFAHDPTSVTTRQVSEDHHLADLVEVFDAIPATPLVLGFCWGAEMGWRLVTRRTPRKAALLYGIGPDEVETVACPVLAVYAEHDPRVNETVPALCEKLLESAVDYRLCSYPRTSHAFHDRHRPERHHPVAADALWRQVMEFLSG